MATQTSKLRLNKPSYTDTVDIQVINVNMDTIDNEFVKVDKDINDLKSKNVQQDKEIQGIKDSVNGISLKAKNVSIEDVNNNFTSTDVEGALNELFQGVDNGKGLIASAITDKGVNASKNDSYRVLSDKILNISGIDIITAPSLPSTGKENRICIITNVVPNKVSVAQFESDLSYSNGDICIKISSLQLSGKDVLVGDGKNGIKLYLDSCVQLINNAQTPLRLYKYVFGRWVLVLDLETPAYDIDLFSPATGYDSAIGSLARVSSTGDITYFANSTPKYIKIYVIGSGDNRTDVQSTKVIDVTKYKKLVVDFRNSTGSYNTRQFSIAVGSAYTATVADSGSLELDISNVVGTQYIKMSKHCQGTSESVTIDKISLYV